jgi:hypothetical protein
VIEIVATTSHGPPAYGSPDIGRVRVVVDRAAGRITTCEPRRMR